MYEGFQGRRKRGEIFVVLWQSFSTVCIAQVSQVMGWRWIEGGCVFVAWCLETSG